MRGSRTGIGYGARLGGFAALVAAAVVVGSPAQTAELVVTKPAAKVDAPLPLPRVRPAAIRLPAAVRWLPQRRQSLYVRVVSVTPPPLISWRYYPIVHGVGF